MRRSRLPYYVGKSLRNPGLAMRLLVLHLIVVRVLTRLCYRLFGHRFLARVATLAVDADSARPDRPTILCSSRLLFDKDIAQLRRLATATNWLSVDSGYLSRPQEEWLPPELRVQRSYHAHREPHHLAAWQRSTDFAECFLRRLHRHHGLAAVLGSNFDYWQEEGLRLACRRLNIPFLVMSQEHLTIPSYGPINVAEIQALGLQLTDTAIAVFGQSTKDYLAEAGICPPERIHVTGAPRFDAWFQGEAPQVFHTLTLLSYADPNYLAPDNFVETLRLFYAAAANCTNPRLRFVVKCKSPQDREDVAALAGLPPPPNLTLESDIQLHDLLPRSRLVIGYNSLALLEALLSPALLVCPQWGDADRPSEDQQVPPGDPDCMRQFAFPRSAAALAEIIASACRDDFVVPGVSEARRNLFRRYFHIPQQGSASEAVQAFVHRYIAASAAGGAR